MTADLFANTATSWALKTNAFGDRYLYNINRGSFDKISAQAIFENAFGKSIFQEDTLYIIIGSDSGLLIKYVETKGIPSGSRYIFVEPEETLCQLQKLELITDLPPQIICDTPSHWEEHAKTFKINEYSYINSIKLLNGICAQNAVIDEYTELTWIITESIRKIHQIHNTSLGSEPFIVRQIENIAENILPASLLSDFYKGKTVIILAGGPSLTSILPWLIENKNKLVIFSVSRISRQLVNAGIEPDFLFSVDPQNENIDVSKEMFLFGNKTIFINSYHVQPELLNQWHGQSLYLGTRIPWQSEFNIKNHQGAGPTVTNSALSTAHLLGFQRILLAGFDLCFTKEGISHAMGSDEQLAGPRYDPTLINIETYNGEYRPTSHGYYTALLTLENQAKLITTAGCELINLSPTAAKVENIKFIPTHEIILDNTSEKTDPTEILPKLTSKSLNSHYRAAICELQKAAFHMEAIIKLSNKAITINDRMYNSNGLIENHSEKRQLDAIERTIEKKHKKYSKLVKRFGIRHFIKINSPHDSSDWTSEKAKNLGDIYYKAYHHGAQKLLSLIKESINRINSRQEELKSEPDFDLLINQWQIDKSYRRAELWLQKNPLSNPPETVLLELKSIQNQFKTAFSNKNTTFKANVEKTSTLAMLKSKMKLLFRYQKKADLVHLKAGFINDSKHSNKEPYLLLIDGYIAELSNDSETALNCYNNIINQEQSPLLEEALLRIASISLSQENSESALLALDCLTQLSPLYLPYQAELARIVGNIMLAIDSYNAYIEFFPQDTLSQLKLAALYMEIKVYAAAEMMLEHILQTSPEMEAALSLKTQLNNKNIPLNQFDRPL
ncbi:MAG: hypothetical protein CTY19_08155 [Methylomonas sp.]|nr:MAG: hypothetical protein CTY19_08155 [Methylomonas sp.]